MQTSIEWFYEQLDSVLELYPSEWGELGKLLQQAKEMHKQEHRRTFIHGVCENGKSSKERFEQYYQDTFKKD